MARKPDAPRPPLSAEETRIFTAAMADVRRLKPAPAPPAAPESAAPESPALPAGRKKPHPRPAPVTPLPPPAPPDLSPALPSAGKGPVPGLDRRQAERLRTGRIAIEARLDLHGMTADDAHAALLQFLTDSLAAERRCLLVITGKGRRTADPDAAGGVLRRSLPRWLQQAPLRRQILAARPAAPQHGGEGAFYILLRRRREP